jgi:hypothetical protein
MATAAFSRAGIAFAKRKLKHSLALLRLIVFAAVFLALGATAGYKFALVREHDRLERNKNRGAANSYSRME